MNKSQLRYLDFIKTFPNAATEKFELNTLLVAFQRTASTAVSQALCKVYGVEHQKMDANYPYQLFLEKKRENMKISEIIENGFYFFNHLGYVSMDNNELWNRADYFLLNLLLKRAKRIVWLKREDAITHSISRLILDMYDKVHKGTSFFGGMQAYVDKGVKLEIADVVHAAENSLYNNLIMQEILKPYLDKLHTLTYFDLFISSEAMQRSTQTLLANFLELPTSQLDIGGWKMTRPQKIINRIELEDYFKRSLDEHPYWSEGYDSMKLREFVFTFKSEYFADNLIKRVP